MRPNQFCVSLIALLASRMTIIVSALATILAIPSYAAEKLAAHPKLVHRQIGGGYTLALELERRDKTFFFCAPNKINCISVTAIGWRKPFVIFRVGGVAPGFDVLDTSSKKSRHFTNQSALPSYLRNLPVDPAGAVWEKLSATRPIW